MVWQRPLSAMTPHLENLSRQRSAAGRRPTGAVSRAGAQGTARAAGRPPPPPQLAKLGATCCGGQNGTETFLAGGGGLCLIWGCTCSAWRGTPGQAPLPFGAVLRAWVCVCQGGTSPRPSPLSSSSWAQTVRTQISLLMT